MNATLQWAYNKMPINPILSFNVPEPSESADAQDVLVMQQVQKRGPAFLTESYSQVAGYYMEHATTAIDTASLTGAPPYAIVAFNDRKLLIELVYIRWEESPEFPFPVVVETKWELKGVAE